MNYVDGFVMAVPKAKMPAYLKLARKSAKLYMKYGALAYQESVADDVKPGKVTSFPQAVKLKRGEVVVLTWIIFRSRKHRDAVNAKVMADPWILAMSPKDMPFDGMRMIWGGFKTIVKA